MIKEIIMLVLMQSVESFRTKNKNEDELTTGEKLANDKANKPGSAVNLANIQVNNKRVNKTLNPVKNKKKLKR